MTIDEITENFSLLDEWDDRYRYVIELGRTLEPLSEAEHSAKNKVQGCVSQVWLSKRIDRIERGLAKMHERGELAKSADPHELAIALLSAVQGGLLLAKGTRTSRPLEIAMDMAIDHVARHMT